MIPQPPKKSRNLIEITEKSRDSLHGRMSRIFVTDSKVKRNATKRQKIVHIKAICSETNFETAHDETINMNCSCARAHKNHRYINYVHMKKSALIA